MTFEMWLVLGILITAVVLFITEKLRVDVVALGVVVALMLSRILTPAEAISGFSNTAVLTIASLFVVGGAVLQTGLAGMIGRRILIHSHFIGRSRDKNGAVVLLLAFGLMAVGYVGLFFGRWIKAAVSRQREYLADASAVQFTRDPDGIAGALKKIAVFSNASYLDADTEEISHMLFGDGRKMMMFSTHPPLNDRISRVDSGFRPEELDRLAAQIQRDQLRARDKAERQQHEAAEPKAGIFDAGRIIDQIGNPDWDRMLMAAAIAASTSDLV